MPSVPVIGARSFGKDGGDLKIDDHGEAKVSPARLGDAPFDMRGGERVVQVAAAAVMRVTLDERNLLGDTIRGSGGSGSTSR